ncbi:MAG: glycosyltransferase 87 family protein [Chloroflexota bacterium]
MAKSLSSNAAPWRLSWDAILFAALWGAQFWSSELSGYLIPTRDIGLTMLIHLTRVMSYDPFPALLLLTLLAYLGADVWLRGRQQMNVKLIAVWLTIIAFVLIPTVAAILYRHNSAPHLYIHDGAIQAEEAIKFLLAGSNPYAEDYLNTPMARWSYRESGVTVNPALYHLPYLPLTFLAGVPFYFLSQFALGWYDQRFVYLLMFVALVLLLLRLGRTPRDKLAMVMLVALTPLFVPFFIEGRNDIVPLFWLIGSIYSLQRGRADWAGVWLACAAVSKQTAWFMLPFFALYVLAPAQQSNWRDLARRAHVFIPAIILFVVIVAPFVTWNPAAFMEDVINFQSGISAGPTNYPIKSLGLGSLAVGFGLVEKITDPFPFSIFQIGLSGLTLAILLARQWRNNTLAQMTINYAILFFVSAFFSRTFNNNHLGFALIWFFLPTFLADSDPLARAEATS